MARPLFLLVPLPGLLTAVPVSGRNLLRRRLKTCSRTYHARHDHHLAALLLYVRHPQAREIVVDMVANLLGLQVRLPGQLPFPVRLQLQVAQISPVLHHQALEALRQAVEAVMAVVEEEEDQAGVRLFRAGTCPQPLDLHRPLPLQAPTIYPRVLVLAFLRSQFLQPPALRQRPSTRPKARPQRAIIGPV